MNKWGKIILPKNNTLLYLLTILITVIATFAIYESNKYVLEKQIQKEFSYTSQKKAEEVKQWYESEKFAVSFFQQTTFFARGLKAYLNNPNDVKLKKQIIERLAASNKNEKYENIILTDSLGNVVLSLKNLSIRKTDSLITRGIQASIFNEKIHFQQLYDKGQATYKLFFIVPIGLPNEKPFATLIFSIDPRKELFDIVTKWPILDSTTHLHLISYEKNKYVLLNHYPQETIESFSVKTPTAEFIALQNKGKVIIGKDFYGKKVATLSIPIENTEWILLVKADYENLFAPLADRKRIFIWTALAIIVTISILFRLIQISQERFFYKQLLHKERVWNNQLKEYRTILYNIGDGVITTDRNGRITMMNAVAEQLTGYKEAEAINTPFAKVFNIANEYTLEPVETPIEKVIREKRVVGLANHTVLISRNGEKIPIVDSGAPVIDDLGNIQGVVLVFRDAREEKIREAKIREAERQYRTLFESIPNGVALHELVFNQENQPENYRILAVNHRYEEILQISRDQAIGKLATDLYSTPLPPYLDTYKQVAMSNLPVEFEAFFPQVNKYFHISVFSPEKNKFATVFQDITEKKLLETERYRLLNILESSLNEIYVFDFNDWHYEYVNQGGILNTGYSAKELKEKTPIDLLSNITKEEFEQFLLPVIEKKKKSIMLESFHRRKDGTQYPIEAHIQMHEEHNHKVFLAIVTDISEKKKYKQEVVSLEQKYTELFNSVTEAIFIHEIPSGTIVDVNEAVVKLYGYSSKKEVIEQCNIGTLSDFERGYTQERAEELIR
ncbi:MAG: PAS domain S-box protein, partial [Bacteroidales bacterium]|nr:PAS domain S-box protein [Bacteroidales bacterium]